MFSLSTVIYAQASYPPIYEDISKFKVVDTAYLKCTYKLDFIKDISKPEKKHTDLQILLIGKNMSKYFSLYKSDHYKFVKEYIKTSGKELDKLYKRIHYDYAHYMRTNYEVTIEEYRSGKFIEVQHSSARVPYNPIELE